MGKMGERELREKMMGFSAGNADVLVATTIIESGLDIPQANTLIVERADTLGLAQLYQILGRVGRSDAVAHAYLSTPPRRSSPGGAAASPRLADHTELGAGSRSRARPRDPRRRRAARRRAVRGTSRQSASPAYGRPPDRGGCRASGQRRILARPSASMPRGRLRAGRLHRERGAQDRPAPPDRARRVRGRSSASCASRSRSPSARSPSRSSTCSRSGGEAPARRPRRGLPRVPWRSRHDRPARARLGGGARSPRLDDTRLRERAAARCRSATTPSSGLRLVDAIVAARQAA